MRPKNKENQPKSLTKIFYTMATSTLIMSYVLKKFKNARSSANMKGGAETVADFNITQNVKGVHFRFRPDSTNLDDLTTKAFGKKVTFGNGYYQEQSGPKAPKIPLAAAEPEP